MYPEQQMKEGRATSDQEIQEGPLEAGYLDRRSRSQPQGLLFLQRFLGKASPNICPSQTQHLQLRSWTLQLDPSQLQDALARVSGHSRAAAPKVEWA